MSPRRFSCCCAATCLALVASTSRAVPVSWNTNSSGNWNVAGGNLTVTAEIWADNYDATTPGAIAVPEPPSLALALASLALALAGQIAVRRAGA